jgi:hypothetical protein
MGAGLYRGLAGAHGGRFRRGVVRCNHTTVGDDPGGLKMIRQSALLEFAYWYPQNRCRYWSPTAQPYATGDQLLHFLEDNWQLESRIEVEHYTFGPGRFILIFHVGLHKHGRRLMMPVTGGPFMGEILDHNPQLEVVPVRPVRQWALRVWRARVSREKPISVG